MITQNEFDAWIAAVDREITRACGLTHSDLPDQNWWDWCEGGYTPAEAARECLESEEFPFDDE